MLDDDLDIFETDELDMSPLHIASLRGHVSVARALLRRGASPDVKDCTQQTPLHLASLEGHLGVIEELLQAGASLDIQDSAKQRPVDLAESPLVVAMLERARSTRLRHDQRDAWAPDHSI